MTQRIKFIFGYWLLWVLIFQIARCVFLLYHHTSTIEIGITESLLTLWHGLRMDMSMAAYFSALLTLLVLFFLPAKDKWLDRGIRSLNVLLTLLAITIILCDLPAYSAWGYRLDATPLKYLKTPGEAMASVSHLPLFWLALSWMAFIIFTIVLLNRYVRKEFHPPATSKEYLVNIGSLLLILGLHILPIRGGWQLAPINQSTVYFSNKAFANHAAVNVTWNFFFSLDQDYDNGANPFQYLDTNKANAICKKVFQGENNSIRLIDSVAKPNIVFIVWESGTEKAVDQLYEGVSITPGFSALKKEGVYFSELYATGDRTDKGIVGVLSGYPAQPITSIIKNPEKSAKLATLPQALNKKGYNCSFVYGGELEFANMKSYLLNSGFNHFIAKNDFDSKDMNSKWGAHDGVVADRLMNHLRQQSSPFFCTWLTLSSHEPFETPVSPVYQDKTETGLFVNSLHYTDSILFHFISACKKESFWKNTLFVIIADHGHRLPATNREIDRFRIPMLWLGGALKSTSFTVNKIGAQTDLASTILAQLNLNDEGFPWSRNMLSSGYNPSAYFTFNNGFGYTKPGAYFIFDNTGKQITEQTGMVTPFDLDTGKAIQQMTFGDYLEK